MNSTRYYKLASAVLASLLWVPMLQAQEANDSAWREFQHALGAPAPIGANASHPLAETSVRPFPAVALEEINARKYLLGSDLYHDRGLSVDGSIGCFICHAGPLSGTDGRAVSRGVQLARGKVNALTTFNAAFNFRQFWDGRAITLADQALMPIVTEHEMANTLEQVLAMLQADTGYVAQFSAIYPDAVSINNLADAIAHFERFAFAVTDTPFQRHLQGEENQLSEQERRGWQRFQEIGCISCHNGINLGGNSYQKLGAMQSYFPLRREADANDAGLAERTGREQDLHVFKVPSLHSVAVTEPYLHDGSLTSLHTTITEMALFQLGRQLSEEDSRDIVAFLVALNGPPEGLSNNRDIELTARAQSGSPAGAMSHPATSHQEAYNVAADMLAPAHAQLLNELGRVQEGEVAHFDFVQFQHLEMIRHARALNHPPSSFGASHRQCLQAGAEQMLEEVLALELPIADFLQAQALMGVLNAHLLTPAPESPDPADIATQISAHRAAAGQSLQIIAAAPVGAADDLLRGCAL